MALAQVLALGNLLESERGAGSQGRCLAREEVHGSRSSAWPLGEVLGFQGRFLTLGGVLGTRISTWLQA